MRQAVVAAVRGDDAALRRLASDESIRRQVETDRVGPLLADAADRRGVDGPELDHWRHLTREAALQHLTLSHAETGIGRALGARGVRWTTIKGAAIARLAHSRPEHRPTTDLDLLVP